MCIHEFSVWRTVPDGKFDVIVEKAVSPFLVNTYSNYSIRTVLPEGIC